MTWAVRLVGFVTGREGSGAAARQVRTITPYSCAARLQRFGWRQAGAGPNHIYVHMQRGAENVSLTVTLAERIGLTTLQDAIVLFNSGSDVSGRRRVLVHQGFVENGVDDEAAALNITLLDLRQLPLLQEALDRTAGRLARRQAEELAAVTRAYDTPNAAQLLPNITPGEHGPILETEHIACFLRDRGGDTLLITFTNQWTVHTGRNFWADQAASELGLSILGFVAKTPCWYPADEMAVLISALSKLNTGRFSVQITSGHSQGGYAAIKYSAALSATTVVAFSPQFSIDRRLLADSRVNGFYIGVLNAGMSIKAEDVAGRIEVVFDPKDTADLRHAEAIGAVVPIRRTHAFYAGHATERGMTNAARLARLLKSARSEDVREFCRFIAEERSVRSERSVFITLALAERKPNTAIMLMQTRYKSWKTDQVMGVCYRFAKAGLAKEALIIAEEVASTALSNANVQGTTGLIAAEMRHTAKARVYLEKALQVEPESAKWREAVRRLNAADSEWRKWDDSQPA